MYTYGDDILTSFGAFALPHLPAQTFPAPHPNPPPQTFPVPQLPTAATGGAGGAFRGSSSRSSQAERYLSLNKERAAEICTARSGSSGRQGKSMRKRNLIRPSSVEASRWRHMMEGAHQEDQSGVESLPYLRAGNRRPSQMRCCWFTEVANSASMWSHPWRSPGGAKVGAIDREWVWECIAPGHKKMRKPTSKGQLSAGRRTVVKAMVSGYPSGAQHGHHTMEGCIAEWQEHCALGVHPHPAVPQQARPALSSASATPTTPAIHTAPVPPSREQVCMPDFSKLSLETKGGDSTIFSFGVKNPLEVKNCIASTQFLSNRPRKWCK
ncbi:hypothetical protein B0H14DRAFT_2606037 [Mycena olivaceomarginata]|nr:hypothetical protein B0H14DRAFT_2606037 [Mycena olivaceomarginata]